MARHHRALVRVTRALLGSDAAAEEVAQETWLAVLGGIAAFEGRSSLKSWIFRIAINRARTRVAREGRMVPLPTGSGPVSDVLGGTAVDAGRFAADGSWASPPSSWDASPDAVLLRKEVRGAIERAIDALPAAQRAVLILRDVEGLDAAEVCEALEIGESNQRGLLHRARIRVRAELAQVLGEGSDR